jgi:hypothetical protein
MHVFSHRWKIDPKINIYTKTNMIYTNSVAEHVCNSVTTLWKSGKERKEKRMIKQPLYLIPQDVKVEDIRMCIERC